MPFIDSDAAQGGGIIVSDGGIDALQGVTIDAQGVSIALQGVSIAGVSSLSPHKTAVLASVRNILDRPSGICDECRKFALWQVCV